MTIQNITRYSVICWNDENTWAALSLDEHYKTLSGARRFAEKHPEYRKIMIREDNIYFRSEDTEISSSSPLLTYEYGKLTKTHGKKVH